MQGANEQVGYVVIAAAGFRGFNQVGAGFFERLLIDCFGHLLLFDVARHAIAAHQQNIVGLEFMICQVGSTVSSVPRARTITFCMVECSASSNVIMPRLTCSMTREWSLVSCTTSFLRMR